MIISFIDLIKFLMEHKEHDGPRRTQRCVLRAFFVFTVLQFLDKTTPQIIFIFNDNQRIH
jgi:hypothetical protein